VSRIFRTRIGDVAVTALRDTYTRVPMAGFVLPELQPDFTPYAHMADADGKVVLSMTAFLFESEGRRILVDTCLADQPLPRSGTEEPHRLPEVMVEAECPPESIDAVVHTHLHFDHVGWNTHEVDGRRVPTFPNARHLISKPDWEFWVPPCVAGEPRLNGPDYERHLRPLEAAGMIDYVEDDNHAITSEVSVIHARGHTPGHQAVRVESGGERGYVIGDACHLPAQACEPQWSSRADIDPAMAAATRAALFQRIEDEGALILSGHFPFPGIGRRVTVDGRRDYRPV
jgi:glyoxylase-like metal-dependent hydrolase (beta-lactamase superfamily II)